jgi:hypothetical protein
MSQMIDEEIAERLSTLETKVEELAGMADKVDKLYSESARFHGFVGGVMFFITVISAFCGSLFRSWFMGHWR